MSNPGPVSGVVPPQPTPNVLDPNARVLSVPQDLSDVRIAIKIAGQIVASNNDGTVKVQTDQGTVDLTIAKPPAEGQQVEVTLLPGRPPRQAIVQDAPPSVQTTPQSPSITPRPSVNQPEPPRTIETPVNVEITPPATPSTPSTGPVPSTPAETPPVIIQPGNPVPPVQTVIPPVTVLAPDVIVTVLPLTPVQEQNIILPPSVLPEVPVSATQVLQNIPPVPIKIEIQTPDLQAQPLLNASATTSPLTTPSVLPQSVATLANPALQNPQVVQVQPAVQASTTLQISPAPQAPPLAASSPQIAPLQTAMIAVPEIEVLPNIITKALQVQIQSIAPPPENFTIPVNAKGTPDLFTLIKPETVPDTPMVKTGIISGFLNQKPVLTVFTPQGAPLQNLLLQASPENIIAGTQIRIALPSPPVQPSLPSALAETWPLAFLTPEPWPLLQEVAQTLSAAQNMPQIMQMMANITPTPSNPAHFSPAALFFLAAVRAGDLGAWMGDKALDILRRDGRAGIISRLTQETGALKSLDSQPISNDWRAMGLPLYWQGEMHKMALYYRHEDSGSAEGSEKQAFTRFIFDLNLSRMGKVQLDGLFRPKKLDLIVRTERAFGQFTQMEMRRTYTGALEQTDLSGELSFQNKAEQFVSITPNGKELFSSNI